MLLGSIHVIYASYVVELSQLVPGDLVWDRVLLGL